MRHYFVPKTWNPKPTDIEWAMKTFRIDRKEFDRQVELLRDHEFRRPYSCWDRVCRNWMRKAEEIQSLRKERVKREEEALDPAKVQADWERDMERLGVKVMRR